MFMEAYKIMGFGKELDTAREDKAWHQSGHYPWKNIMGGDGMQIQIDNEITTSFIQAFSLELITD